MNDEIAQAVLDILNTQDLDVPIDVLRDACAACYAVRCSAAEITLEEAQARLAELWPRLEELPSPPELTVLKGAGADVLRALIEAEKG